MINFLNLEYFLVLSQELNFSRAAKQLFISQQSLSAHIARMENELGVTLYERTKPLSLTAAGKHFQLRAQEMLNLREQTLQELSASTIYHADKISLGISYAYSRTLLPKILPSFFQQCPNIQLKLYERNAIDLDEALNNGEIDLILGRLPFMAANVQSVPVCEDRMILMIPEQILEREFGSDKDAIKLSLREKANLQLLKNGPFLLTKHGRVRNLTNDIFLNNHLTPKVIMETETIETAVVLCQYGLGILIVPSLFVQDKLVSVNNSSNSGIHFIPLSNQTFGIIACGYSKDLFMTNAMKSFIQVVCEKLKHPDTLTFQS